MAPTYQSGGILLAPPHSPRTFATRLRQSMKEFEAGLKDTENFKMMAAFGSRLYPVEHINVRGQELVIIEGPAEDPARFQILCHVNDLQLMLQVEPKQPHEKRRRIGFIWEEEKDKEAGEEGEEAPEEAAAEAEADAAPVAADAPAAEGAPDQKPQPEPVG